MKSSQAWHSFAIDKVLATLNTNRESGLSTAQVTKLTQAVGPNEIPRERSFYILESVLKQLKSPLSLVLLAAGIATLFLGEYLDALVILFALLINIVVGVMQEGKAARVFEALDKSQEKYATVVRDGKQQVIAAAALVPGDITILQGGAAIPADVRLIEVQDMAVNEAALTGEWLPVEKIATSLGRALPTTEQKNMAWMGTLVAEGSGVGVVVATGENARFGQIAKSTQETADTSTPLQKNIHRIARFLMGVILFALGIIIVLGLVRGEPLTEMLLLAIAVAVAAMPEGLPAAVTVVLAIGMESILRKGGLVKNLLAAETLGSTTTILTDKTGTLTQGRMLLDGLYTAQGLESNTTEAHDDNRELLQMAVLASDAFVEEDPKEAGKILVRGRPLEKAIMEAGLAAGVSQRDLFANGFQRIDFIQFESSRRYAISLNESPQKGNRLYLSGSPEHLLARSSKYFFAGRERKLTKEVRDSFAQTQANISAEGLRFTAVAYLKTDSDTVPESVESASGGKEFVFVGLIAFADAVREDVPKAIREAQEAGARVIMATGDYPETARAIAREVGIDTRENAPVLTGVMIDEMEDKELLQALQTYRVVARVLPEQKLRVARLLRNDGEVVAMTGDGVNDAPALVAADIGVAVGSGTEVAKAAADLVLIDNSFSVITAAIAEGRRVVANLRKIVTHLLSTSFTEIIIIAGAFAAGAPLPLLPAQILWANIVGEGFLSFPFAFEPQEKGVMTKKPEKRGVQSIITTRVKWFIFIVSTVSGTLLLGLFFLLLWGGIDIDKIRTVMFLALSIGSVIYVFSFKDLSRPIWKIDIFSNKILIGALGASLSLLAVAMVFEPLRTLLSLTTITFSEVLILIGIGCVNLVLIEAGKYILNKRLNPRTA